MANYGTGFLDDRSNESFTLSEARSNPQKPHSRLNLFALTSLAVTAILLFSYSAFKFLEINGGLATSFERYGKGTQNGDSEDTTTSHASGEKKHCTDSIFDFELMREGYSSLPYFSANASDIKRYYFLADYDGVVEPYANMTLKYSTQDTLCSILSYFEFVVLGDNHVQLAKQSFQDNDEKTSGVFNVDCEPYEAVAITIEAFSESGDQIGTTQKMQAMCMYVRRELRELTEGDLKRSINAM